VKAMSQTVDKGRAKALFLYQKIPFPIEIFPKK
jgi:hypothetical protein